MNIDLKNIMIQYSGKVFTLFEDKPQSDVLVKLLDKTNNKVTSKVFTDNSGILNFKKFQKAYIMYSLRRMEPQYFAEKKTKYLKYILEKINL